jgi:polar amino acid transport system substrate-binding protein
VKRISIVTLLVILLASTFLAACKPQPTKIRVATDATFPPFETVDEKTKEFVGFDMDLIKDIAAKENMQIEIVNTPFDSVIAGMKSCDYEVAIAAISNTPERAQAMLFSDAYTTAGQVVVVRTNEKEIKGKDTLTSKTIAAQIGTTGEIEAKKITGVTYKPYDTYDLAFLDLMNGQVDAVISDNMTALGFINKNPDKIMTVGEMFTSESYSIAVCKNSQPILDKINAGLKALKDDGTIHQLELKWLANTGK